MTSLLGTKRRNKRKSPKWTKNKKRKMGIGFVRNSKKEKFRIKQLPVLMNPSFHKQIFNGYRKACKLKKPSISYAIRKQRKEEADIVNCTLSVAQNSTKNEKKQRIVISVNSRSKKSAEIAAYAKFNYDFIPFLKLQELMKPFAFANKLNLQQIKYKRGMNFKSVTNTIIIEPMPINCSICDLFLLFKKHLKNRSHTTTIMETIKNFKFERHSSFSMYQRVFIELMTPEMADVWIRVLNGKLFGSKHVICMDWCKHNLLKTSAKSDNKHLHFLQIHGFRGRGRGGSKRANNISEKEILQFLYRNGCPATNIRIASRFAIVSVVFAEFESDHECEQCFNKMTNNGSNCLFAKKITAHVFRNGLINDDRHLNGVSRATKCIDVRNVAWNVTETDLTQLLQKKCGQVSKLHINYTKHFWPGTAFVEFANDGSAQIAVEKLNNHSLKRFCLQIELHFGKRQNKQTNTE